MDLRQETKLVSTPELQRRPNEAAAAQAAANQLAAIKTLFDQLTQWQQQLTKPTPPATAMQ